MQDHPETNTSRPKNQQEAINNDLATQQLEQAKAYAAAKEAYDKGKQHDEDLKAHRSADQDELSS